MLNGHNLITIHINSTEILSSDWGTAGDTFTFPHYDTVALYLDLTYPPARVVTTCLLRLHGRAGHRMPRRDVLRVEETHIGDKIRLVRIAEPALAIPCGDPGKFWVLKFSTGTTAFQLDYSWTIAVSYCDAP